MKKILANTTFAAVMMVLSLVFSTHGTKANDLVMFSKTIAEVHFTISIPDEWNTYIVKEEKDDVTTFKFKKADGTKEFLFSVNKVSAQQWLAVKDDMPNVKMLDHKGDTIYFAQYTDKQKIKGEGNGEYSKIYQHLNEIIASVKIAD